MWHSVLEEEVFRLEIVASQKLVIDQKVEESILELEAQLKTLEAHHHWYWLSPKRSRISYTSNITTLASI